MRHTPAVGVPPSLQILTTDHEMQQPFAKRGLANRTFQLSAVLRRF
jgi:hypothetical protein